MMKKWRLFERALSESYPLSWILLRMSSFAECRSAFGKKRTTSRFRHIGYVRGRYRRVVAKIQTKKMRGRRFLTQNVPIT